MSSTQNCDWCGKTGYRERGMAPKGWVQGSSWTRIKWFCGNRCKTEYENSQKESNSSTSTNNSNSNSAELELQKLELAKMKMEERRLRENENKIKEQELANNTIKFYNILKPYLKYIIPIYIVAFVITYLLVKPKNHQVTIIFFSFPLFIIIYLIYNVMSNKTK
jgi:hypothetical protein